MAWYGPILAVEKSVEKTAYTVEWAHCSYLKKLLIVSYGPSLAG
jgi:hypothetical protein